MLVALAVAASVSAAPISHEVADYICGQAQDRSYVDARGWHWDRHAIDRFRDATIVADLTPQQAAQVKIRCGVLAESFRERLSHHKLTLTNPR